MMEHSLPLFGDGVHDDTAAIQQLLDQKKAQVSLPVPQVCYSISSTLRIHSNQTLTLPATALIRLAPGSDCLMLANAEPDAHDICVEGGIWDYNNLNQSPNPLVTGVLTRNKSHSRDGADAIVQYADCAEYLGVAMRFAGVTRLCVRNLTFKDPITFCLQLGNISYFTVENILFDMNLGNPLPLNMDGVHVDGGCRFGMIHNVQGACYDDIVALNADDFNDGPIEDIVIDGVYGEHSLRGVRLLSTKSPVKRISISNVFGTYYQNAVLLSYYYPFSGQYGCMDDISIRNVMASHAPRLPEYRKPPEYQFAHIHVTPSLMIGHLTLDTVRREELHGDIETLRICENTKIDTLNIARMAQKNLTGKPFPMISVEGEVNRLYLMDADAGSDERLRITGQVHRLIDLDA